MQRQRLELVPELAGNHLQTPEGWNAVLPLWLRIFREEIGLCIERAPDSSFSLNKEVSQL